MLENILQHLQKILLFKCSFLYTKKSLNTKIKLISLFPDGMNLMIFIELEIVGPEEHPKYKL